MNRRSTWRPLRDEPTASNAQMVWFFVATISLGAGLDVLIFKLAGLL